MPVYAACVKPNNTKCNPASSTRMLLAQIEEEVAPVSTRALNTPLPKRGSSVSSTRPMCIRFLPIGRADASSELKIFCTTSRCTSSGVEWCISISGEAFTSIIQLFSADPLAISVVIISTPAIPR